MTHADASALRSLADALLENNPTGLEFKIDVKQAEDGEWYFTLWNSHDQFTEELRTVQQFADFFRTRFLLQPVFCFHHTEYRNPKMQPPDPYICVNCERVIHYAYLEATIGFTGETTGTVTDDEKSEE